MYLYLPRYKVLSVKKAVSKDQVEDLIKLQMKMPKLDFWSDPSLTRKTDILVAPHELLQVEGYLLSKGLHYEVAIPDVQR